MLRRFLIGLLCALVAVSANAAVTYLDGGGFNVTTITTTSDCPAGSLIVVNLSFVGGTNDFSASTVTDSASNSYTFIAQSANPGGTPVTALFYSSNTANDLPNGGTITTNASSPNFGAACIDSFSGGLDVSNSNATASNVTTLSVTIPTLAQSSEVIIGAMDNLTNMAGISEGNGYTRLGGSFFDFAYLLAASTTPPAYSPSWTNTSKAGVVVAAFKATGGGGGGSTPPTLRLLGVGK